jgi:microcystin-dependent protein
MDEVFVGELAQFPYRFCPADWAYCHGQLLAVSQYEVLYTLIGTTFGGDGVNTFAVPDLRPKDPNGNLLNLQVGQIYEGKPYMETFISLQGIYPTQD